MDLAPVLITTLNRKKHLSGLLESLSECNLSSQTDIYISVDYPPDEKYVNGHGEVVEYLKKGIKGFHSVNIFFQDKNLGPSKNIDFLINIVKDKYDRWILSEDDNIFSQNFLEYMNKGLELFKDDETVFALTSANDKVAWKTNGSNVIKTYNVCAWGIGFWRKKFDAYVEGLTNEKM